MFTIRENGVFGDSVETDNPVQFLEDLSKEEPFHPLDTEEYPEELLDVHLEIQDEEGETVHDIFVKRQLSDFND